MQGHFPRSFSSDPAARINCDQESELRQHKTESQFSCGAKCLLGCSDSWGNEGCVWIGDCQLKIKGARLNELKAMAFDLKNESQQGRMERSEISGQLVRGGDRANQVERSWKYHDSDQRLDITSEAEPKEDWVKSPKMLAERSRRCESTVDRRGSSASEQR